MNRDEADGYAEMRRIEDPYSGGGASPEDAAMLAEAEYGALGTGSVTDSVQQERPSRPRRRKG